MTDFKDFLLWESSSRDTIDFKKIYVDMADDILAGLMLSEIVFWCLPTHDGNPKMRIERDGYLWIACSRAEWWSRTRMSKRQADHALKILIDKKLIHKKMYLFNRQRTMHLRLDREVFLAKWDGLLKHPAVNPYDNEPDVLSSNQSVIPSNQLVTQEKSNRGEVTNPLQGIPNPLQGVTKTDTPITETTSKTTQKKNKSSDFVYTPQQAELIAAWWNNLQTKPGDVDKNSVYKRKNFRQYAQNLLDQGITASMVASYTLTQTGERGFYRDKALSFQTVAKQCPAWCVGNGLKTAERRSMAEEKETVEESPPGIPISPEEKAQLESMMHQLTHQWDGNGHAIRQ